VSVRNVIRITPNLGGVGENECLNVAPNFIFGYIFLVVALFLLVCQILGYSYQEVVHRIEVVLEPMNKISRRAVQSSWEKRKLQGEKMQKVYNSVYMQFGKRLLRIVYIFIALASMLLIPFFYIAVFTFFTVLRTFYGSIIIWRGQIPFNFTVLHDIEEFVKGLYFKEIELLFYPFTYIYKLLSLFQINLGGIEVTCSGAQLPLVLVINLVVYTVCLFITCTDFQVYADMFSDVLGNWAADVHTHEESGVSWCEIFVAWCVHLVSKLYPDVSFFDAHRSLTASAYFTATCLIWLPI